MQKLIGYNVPEIKIQKVASLAQKLFILQPSGRGHEDSKEGLVDGVGETLSEFGTVLIFRAPTRFLVDESLENELLLEDEGSMLSTSSHGVHYKNVKPLSNKSIVDNGKVDLRWLREECAHIVRQSGSQLSADELAMTLCQVLDSDKAGDEVRLIGTSKLIQNSLSFLF